jgi:hypothetical protein
MYSAVKQPHSVSEGKPSSILSLSTKYGRMLIFTARLIKVRWGAKQVCRESNPRLPSLQCIHSDCAVLELVTYCCQGVYVNREVRKQIAC